VPTYAYACTACGHHLEIHQSFTDDALTICPQCAGHLRKIFFPVGVTFKGSGFYHNDSRGTASGHAGAGKATGTRAGSDAANRPGGDIGSSDGASAAASGSTSGPAKAAGSPGARKEPVAAASATSAAA